MRRQIIFFLALSTLSPPVFGQIKKSPVSASREIIQVSVDGSETTPIQHPTFTVFVIVPKDAHFQNSLNRSSGYSALSQTWKIGISATVFWAGEPPTADDPGNLASAWDADWIETAKSQNPFYVALPYNDVANGHTKPEARSIVPWFSEAYVRDG